MYLRVMYTSAVSASGFAEQYELIVCHYTNRP